jgi:hypothetical protein
VQLLVLPTFHKFMYIIVHFSTKSAEKLVQEQDLMILMDMYQRNEAQKAGSSMLRVARIEMQGHNYSEYVLFSSSLLDKIGAQGDT